MAFEESPQFDGNDFVSRPSLRGWIVRNRRLLLILAAVFFLLDATLAAYLFFPSIFGGAPGGLDGCLVTASGDPVSATIQIAEVTRQTYTDGCFVFPALPPGSQRMTITTDTGMIVLRTVEIISEQALSLGMVTLP